MTVNEAINFHDLGSDPKILAWVSVSSKMDHLAKCQCSWFNEAGFVVPEHFGGTQGESLQDVSGIPGRGGPHTLRNPETDERGKSRK